MGGRGGYGPQLHIWDKIESARYSLPEAGNSAFRCGHVMLHLSTKGSVMPCSQFDSTTTTTTTTATTTTTTTTTTKYF